MKQNKIICGICVLICTALAIAYLFAVPAIFISNSKSNNEQTDNDEIFVTVQHDTYYDVVYHKDTKVMYVFTFNTETRGVVTMLVNADGTPMIYEKGR